jgi:hypothetical protein
MIPRIPTHRGAFVTPSTNATPPAPRTASPVRRLLKGLCIAGFVVLVLVALLAWWWHSAAGTWSVLSG